MLITYKKQRYIKPILEKNFINKNNQYIVEFNIHYFLDGGSSETGDWVSPPNKKHYDIRKRNHNRAELGKVTYSKRTGYLMLYYKVTPTFGGGSKLVPTIKINGEPDKPGRYTGRDGHEKTKALPSRKFYTFIIAFEIGTLIGKKEEWERLDQTEKEELVESMINDSDVYFHSNDPSYLYQGTWKLLTDLGCAVHPLSASIASLDTGYWLDRHDNAGKHVTKHFLNVIPTFESNVDLLVRAIDTEYKTTTTKRKKPTRPRT